MKINAINNINLQTAKNKINKPNNLNNDNYSLERFTYAQAQGLKSLSLYSPSFKSTKIYALTPKGKMRTFNSKANAQRLLLLTKTEMQIALEKRGTTPDGSVLFTGDEIEIKKENGGFELDTEKIEKICREVRQQAQEEEIYVFDDSFECIMLFRDAKTASDELMIPARRIKSCAEGKNGISINDYYFFKASDICQFGPNGERKLNIDVARQLAVKNSRKINGKPIYSISPSGELKRYQSAREASRVTGIDDTSIILARTGARNIDTCGNLYFFDASEIDTLEGMAREAKIDEIKVRAMQIFDKKVPSIYAFSRNGIQKFKSYEAVAEEYVTSVSTIRKKIKSQEPIEGAILALARDVADIQPDGTFKPKEKIVKALRTRALKESIKKSVYLFDKKGNYRRFENLASLIKTLEARDVHATASNARKTFREDKGTVYGYVILKASEIEKLEDDLTISLDLKTALERVAERYKPKNVVSASIHDLD